MREKDGLVRSRETVKWPQGPRGEQAEEEEGGEERPFGIDARRIRRESDIRHRQDTRQGTQEGRLRETTNSSRTRALSSSEVCAGPNPSSACTSVSTLQPRNQDHVRARNWEIEGHELTEQAVEGGDDRQRRMEGWQKGRDQEARENKGRQ